MGKKTCFFPNKKVLKNTIVNSAAMSHKSKQSEVSKQKKEKGKKTTAQSDVRVERHRKSDEARCEGKKWCVVWELDKCFAAIFNLWLGLGVRCAQFIGHQAAGSQNRKRSVWFQKEGEVVFSVVFVYSSSHPVIQFKVPFKMANDPPPFPSPTTHNPPPRPHSFSRDPKTSEDAGVCWGWNSESGDTGEHGIQKKPPSNPRT